MKTLLIVQFVVLLAGTLFAWGNFIYELLNWLNSKSCTTGCAQGLNPFMAPCFWGAMFFSAAFVLSFVILLKF